MALLPRRSSQPDQEFLHAAADMGGERVGNQNLYWAYYDGEQRTQLTDRQRYYLQACGLRFRENFCEPVVDLMAERLNLTGFQVEDKSVKDTTADDQTAAVEYLDRVLQGSRLDAKQNMLYTRALVCKEAFLVAGWDKARKLPVLKLNRPWQVKAVYSDDDPDVMVWASKVWNSQQSGKAIQRLNVYYPDRIEKYFRLGIDGDWSQFRDEGETGWPTPWVDGQGKPLGVPVVRFYHRRSELANVVSQQDALNKLVIDLFEVADYMGWPQRWATGVSSDNANLKPAPGEVLFAADPQASFGQFDAADLAKLIDAIENQVSRIARRSRTPLHLLTGGDQPSGEALKSAESGLVAKVRSAQTAFGMAWEDAALLALRLGVAFGAEKFGNLDALVVQAQWRNPESRDRLGEAQRAQILADLGVSKHTLLTELEYDPEQEAEYRAEEDATLNQAAGKLLDQGAGANGSGLYAGTAVAA